MSTGQRHVVLVESWMDGGIEITDNFILEELKDHKLMPNQRLVELNEEDYLSLKLILAIHKWTEDQLDYLYKRRKLNPKHTFIDMPLPDIIKNKVK